MGEKLSPEALKTLFTEARTHSAWQPKPVADETLQAIYDLMKMGPTSANSCPARFLFVKSPASKEKLLTAMDAGNVEKTRTAPVTVIVAYDMEFYEKMPKLAPHNPSSIDWFKGKPDVIQNTAFRNGSLEGAYFILAARSLGLDCGPMSGFNNKKVDELFFAGTSWKSNFIVNLGYGDASKLHPRAPRLLFEEGAKVV